MKDFIAPVAGNKMLDLKREIKDLRDLLTETDDPEKQKRIRKTIMEKETHYNILADRARIR